jgi:hypothetical protein
VPSGPTGDWPFAAVERKSAPAALDAVHANPVTEAVLRAAEGLFAARARRGRRTRQMTPRTISRPSDRPALVVAIK